MARFDKVRVLFAAWFLIHTTEKKAIGPMQACLWLADFNPCFHKGSDTATRIGLRVALQFAHS